MKAMRVRNKTLWLTGLTVSLVTAWTLTAQQPRKVDDATLKDAIKTGNEWVTYNGSWMEQRHSPLNQINASNVSRLGLAWYTDLPIAASGGGGNRHEATPLVFNGVIYSITPWSIVYAI